MSEESLPEFRGPRWISRRPRIRASSLQNTIHWIKSIAIDQDAAGDERGPDPRLERRALQADQQRPVRQRLPRVHLPLHARRHDPARPSRDRREVPGRVERRALAPRRRGTAAAAAIPGSSPTRRSGAAGREDRPHPATFPPRVAGIQRSGYTVSTGHPAVMDPFLGLGNSAIAAAGLGVDFVGMWDWTRTTSQKPSHALRLRCRSSTPNSQFPTPTPNSQLPIPNSQRPIPNAQFPTPNSQRPIPNAQFPNAQFPTPNSQRPIPNAQFPLRRILGSLP